MNETHFLIKFPCLVRFPSNPTFNSVKGSVTYQVMMVLFYS